LDPHSVERAPDEEERDEEESTGQIMRQGRVAVVTFGETHSQLNSQKTEQRRELDDRVERDGRCIFEGITNRVADDRRIVQRCSLRLEFHFDHLLRVVPRASGVRHKDRLIESEDGNRKQVTDEEERLDESEGERGEEDSQEDIEHPLLRIL